MRIAILADPLDNQRAGVHVFTKELIDAIIALGKADQLILIREKVDENLDVEQIAVPNIHLPIGFASLRLFFVIPYILRKHKIDAVFEPAHFGPFNLPKKIKRITMIHDLTPILLPQYHRWHSQILQRIFLKSILKNTDWILTNSRHTQEDVQKVFPFANAKTSYVYLGKHPSFKPTPNPSRISQLGLKKPYFMYVGTIEPRKNLLTLFKSFELFCMENSSVDLVIVGQLGWKSEEFEAALKKHPFRNRIHLTGFVAFSDLPILYTHSIALVYPSEYEGFGLPIIEALACGTQVIAANNSSLKEIGEGAAVFFDTHNPEDLYEKMRLVYDLSPEDDFKTRIQHADNFSWKKCAESFLEKIEQLI